jgi:hypothetical protein
MAKSFEELFSSARIQNRVSKLIDQTDWELGYLNDRAIRGDGGVERPRTIIDEIFPTTSYQSRQLLVNKYKGNMVVASVIGPDDALPAQRGKSLLTEERLTRTFIGCQHVWTHGEYEMLRDLELYSSAGPENVATANAIEEHILGVAAQMPVAIDAKHLILLMHAATKGSYTYTDPLTGLDVEMTFNDTVAAHLPVAPGTLWNNAGATGLAQLETLAEAYRATRGVKPRILLMHYAELKDLSEQTATKAQIAAKMGTDSTNNANLYVECNYSPTTYEVEPGMLLDAIRARVGPVRVFVFDAKFTEENKAGVKTDQYFLPMGYVMFAQPGMGERARLPFKENNWSAGVRTLTEEINRMPLQERMAAMTAGVPFIPDGRDICAQPVGPLS